MNCSHEHTHEGAATTLSLLGEKWVIQLLHQIVQGNNRFGQLQRAMTGISPKYSWFAYESWKKPGFSSEDMIGLARAHARHEQLEERVHFESGDVAHLPYPDQSFDVVVSTISMHHWSELEQPLRELYRVLRPGGRLWVYDFRFVKVQTVEKALASTPFVETPLEYRLVRTGFLPFALYRRFALQKTAQRDHQQG